MRRHVSANLADAVLAAGATRFIQESFAPIYAPAGDRWVDEGFPVQTARYNRSVTDAEAAAARVTRAGRGGIVLRFSFFYGADSGFVLDLLKSVRGGRAMIMGRPEAFWPSISHDDAATAVVAALGAKPGVYNITDDEPLRRRELADAAALALGVPPPRLLPGWVPLLLGSLGETASRSLRLSNRAFRAETGWAPRYRSAREGLQAVVAEVEGRPAVDDTSEAVRT